MDRDGAERACRVEGRSVDDLSIAGDGLPTDGRGLVCRIDVLGLIHGHVEAMGGGAFRLSLAVTRPRRARIAARIAWHRARLGDGAELRSNPRVVPARPTVFLRWPGGAVEGTLVDVSAGGAALTVSPRPAIGDPVTLGLRRGFVVRQTDDGVAIRFVLPLRPEDVTEAIVL